MSANDALLAAKNQVNLINSTDTDSTRSANESSSASVGVSYGTNGWGVSASMANAHGDSNSDAAMQNNTPVSGANSVSIVSGGDMNIIGANVSGNHVSVDVGGNLNAARCSQNQQQRGGARAVALLVVRNMCLDERGHVAPRHGRLMFLSGVLFRQDVIDNGNRVRRDMAVRPRPCMTACIRWRVPLAVSASNGGETPQSPGSEGFFAGGN